MWIWRGRAVPVGIRSFSSDLCVPKHFDQFQWFLSFFLFGGHNHIVHCIKNKCPASFLGGLILRGIPYLFLGRLRRGIPEGLCDYYIPCWFFLAQKAQIHLHD